MKNKIKNIINNKYIYDVLRIIYQLFTITKIKIARIISFSFRLRKIEENAVLFSNYKGKGLSDNPKYILKELQKNRNIKCYWLLNEGENKNDFLDLNVTLIKNNTLNILYYSTITRVWIDNSRKIYIPYKRKKQIYIQTWHGGLGLKRVEQDISKQNLIQTLTAKWDTNATDYMISNSNHLTAIYKNAFKFKGEILHVGYPSNDPLFEIKQKEINDYKNILYVPTFRGDENNKRVPSYMPDFDELILMLEEQGININKIFVRLHPSLDSSYEIFNDKVVDASEFMDVKDIIPHVDIIISDYSSTIFDGLLSNKESHLYVPDLKEYEKNRGLYYDVYDLPFPVSNNVNNLVTNIKNFDRTKYEKDRENFIEEMGLLDDGHATSRVVEFILNKMEE